MDLVEFKNSTLEPLPVYSVRPKQEFLAQKVYETSREQVQEAARSFDWSVFDLAEDSEALVVDTARTLPWMTSRRWVYVKNADRGTEKLAGYLRNPSSRTVMVLEMQRKPAGWPKIQEITMPSGLQAVQWLQKRAKEEGYELERSAAQALVELVGEDFQLLEANLGKLFLLRLEEKRIDRKSVSDVVSHVPRDDIFALIGAISARRGAEALDLLRDLFAAGASPPQIISILYWNFCRLLVARELLDRRIPFFKIVGDLKIWTYKGRERELRRTSRDHLVSVLLRLRETDRLCKSTSTDPMELLQRLVIDTCQTGAV